MSKPKNVLLGTDHCNAVAFSDEPDFLLAASVARSFAGTTGRMATMPDLVSARLRSPSSDDAWQRGATTATEEYLGESKGGNRIIVVAHGNGPLNDPEHTHDFEADGYGLVSQEQFLRLADGAYGDVSVIELSHLYRLRANPFLEMLTFDQACEDPLVRARLGTDAKAYLDLHRKISKSWWLEQETVEYPNDCVLSLCDTSRRGYASLPMYGHLAYGHFLKLSPLTEYRHAHWDGPRVHTSLVTELSCQLAWLPATVVGVRGKGPITGLHPGTRLAQERFGQYWGRLLQSVPVESRPSLQGLHSIARFGDRWFTRHAGTFGGPGDGEPAHPVTWLKPLSATCSFMMPVVDGNYRRLVPDEDLLRESAPEMANAYAIVSKPLTIWQGYEPAFHHVKVRYFAADIRDEVRLPTKRELSREFDLLLSLGKRTQSEPEAELLEELSDKDIVDLSA